MNRVLWPTELRRHLPNSFMIIQEKFWLVNSFSQKFSGVPDRDAAGFSALSSGQIVAGVDADV